MKKDWLIWFSPFFLTSFPLFHLSKRGKGWRQKAKCEASRPQGGACGALAGQREFKEG